MSAVAESRLGIARRTVYPLMLAVPAATAAVALAWTAVDPPGWQRLWLVAAQLAGVGAAALVIRARSHAPMTWILTGWAATVWTCLAGGALLTALPPPAAVPLWLALLVAGHVVSRRVMNRAVDSAVAEVPTADLADSRFDVPFHSPATPNLTLSVEGCGLSLHQRHGLGQGTSAARSYLSVASASVAPQRTESLVDVAGTPDWQTKVTPGPALRIGFPDGVWMLPTPHAAKAAELIELRMTAV